MSSSSSVSCVTKPHAKDHDEQLERTANLTIICDRYKDRISTLPKDKCWIGENLYLYQGFWHSPSNSSNLSVEVVMAAQDTFQADATDIYLTTLPKSGTTWLKALVFATVNRNRYKNKALISSNHDHHPLLISNPHDCVPYIESEMLRSSPTYINGHVPRLFATHIPYTSLPQSILNTSCHIVYMCRNPKDVLVSFYHFANKLRDKSRGLLKFEEAFEMFSKGIMSFGPYWDHVKGYYTFSVEHPSKVLFLTYEDMKTNTVNNVKHLAEFLGYPFTKEEQFEGVVEDIVSLCSFENLREVNKQGCICQGIPKEAFFREGKVGDWGNYLTLEMSHTLDQITEEKFHGLNISF